MYKKFLLSLSVIFLFANQPIQSVLRIEKSTTQKKDNLSAWMVWKTSKEYTITYHPNNMLDTLEIEPMMGKIKIEAYRTTINKKNTILTGTSCSHLKIVEYNTLHDTACGVDCIKGRYVIYHYRIFKNKKNDTINLWIQPIVELPELDKYCNDKRTYGFNVNNDGTMIAIIIKGGIIAKIVPKKIPSKHLLTFNNLHDVTFKYKN